MSDRLIALALALATGAATAQPGLGDPTRPTALAEPESTRSVEVKPRWRLQSTLVGDTRRLAVINGRTVAQGERIDGATLKEVRQEGVTLEIEGRRVELRVVPVTVGIKRSGG